MVYPAVSPPCQVIAAPEGRVVVCQKIPTRVLAWIAGRERAKSAQPWRRPVPQCGRELEVAPFGTAVMIVEPGGYDTDRSGASAWHLAPLPQCDPIRDARTRCDAVVRPRAGPTPAQHEVQRTHLPAKSALVFPAAFA